MTAPGAAALQRLGVEGTSAARFREAHAFVGVKGAPPGTALEALGPRPSELRIGRPGEASEIELLEFRLDPVPAPLEWGSMMAQADEDPSS